MEKLCLFVVVKCLEIKVLTKLPITPLKFWIILILYPKVSKFGPMPLMLGSDSKRKEKKKKKHLCSYRLMKWSLSITSS